MKFNFIKRALGVVLVLVLVFTCTFSAFASSQSISPVIIIGGIDANPLVINPNTADAEQIFPLSDTEIAFYIGEILTLTTASVASGDYTEILNYAASTIVPIIEKISMNNDGSNKSANVGVNEYPYSLAFYRTDADLLDTVAGTLGQGMASKIGYNNIYVFQYDWRLDPYENADKLAAYVENVKTMSHKDTVTIVSEGYGSTVAVTYLGVYADKAYENLDKFITLSSAFSGTSLIGDLFTGNIIVKDSSMNWPNNAGLGVLADQRFASALIRWTNDYSDNPITASVTGLVNYILNGEWEVQSLCADIVTMMGHVITPLYNNYLRQLLRNFLGLWALVPSDYYEDAFEYMSLDDVEMNATLQQKIVRFKGLQASGATILKNAQKAGVEISIIAAWDVQLLPIGNDYESLTANCEQDINGMDNELYGLSAQSDGRIDTYYASFGAYCTALNDVGRAALINQTCDTDHDHLSDTYDTLDYTHKLGAIAHYIDASTCALPENTYFLRNMKFGDYTADSDIVTFIVWLACTDNTDVWTNGYYTQFLNVNRYVVPQQMSNGSLASFPGAYMVGDVNEDGKVTATDARTVLRMAAKLVNMPEPDTIAFKNADVYNVGTISAQGARRILRVAAKLENF